MPAKSSVSPPVILRTRTRELPISPEGIELLPALAMKWSSMVANRERWDGAERDRKAAEESATRDLERLFGQPATDLGAALGVSGLLEVSVRWGKNESESWPARIMPWEYVIAIATRSMRKGARLIVVRHLDAGPRDTRPTRAEASSGLIVCCNPPAVGAGMQKSLMEETCLVDNLWKDHGVKPKALKNPTKKALEAALAAGADWIHILGANGRDISGKNRDSLVLAGRSAEDLVELGTEEILKLVARSKRKPAVTVFNFCNTAARLAATVVAAGGDAAIGFQDLVSDQVCMDVVGAFYPALKRRKGDLLAAFIDLWEGREVSLDGTVIVLWSGKSLLQTPVVVAKSIAARKEDPPLTIHGVPDPLEVSLKVADAINFSLLHNGCSLFHQFEIGRAHDLPMKDALIEVTVNDGGQSSTWRMLRTFNRSAVCIAKEVQITFISSMVRSLRESLMSSMQVSITCQDRLVFSRSLLIRLLAVDEWLDDDDNRCWLPSFVHPRDPAVAEIITRAEGYLQALCDDFGAGFDGYQAEPEMIGMQVRALWVAIYRDCRIRYINPPPTYTKASQRLRRPTEMLATRQGTCLDLALLLGACLEWIGVYPVVFLISGHAFPGYWRTYADYRAFYATDNEIESPATIAVRQQRQHSGHPGLQRRWITGIEAAPSVLREVQAGRLVPLETVWLTNGRSFADAVQAGRHNLYLPGAFEYLIDVQRAREHGITPLPLPENP